MRIVSATAAILLAVISGQALAQQPARLDPAIADRIVKDTFKGASAEWQARIGGDELESRRQEPRCVGTRL